MASEERKAADHKISEENLFKTLGAGEVQAETDAFQCGRCKQVRSESLHPQAVLIYRWRRGNAVTVKHRPAALMSQ